MHLYAANALEAAKASVNRDDWTLRGSYLKPWHEIVQVPGVDGRLQIAQHGEWKISPGLRQERPHQRTKGVSRGAVRPYADDGGRAAKSAHGDELALQMHGQKGGSAGIFRPYALPLLPTVVLLHVASIWPASGRYTPGRA